MAGFYRELAEDYHLFFPARQAQLDFLVKLAGDPPARLIDSAMQRIAQTRHPDIAHRLVQGDMRELLDDVRGPARLAFCIGNSLPHLSSSDELTTALTQMWQITRPAGVVLLQVVNFDRVLASAAETSGALGFDLPTISATRPDGARVVLERRYEIPKRRSGDDSADPPQHLIFRSKLHHAEGAANNYVNLLLLTRERLEAALPAGATAEWYGDFEQGKWAPGSPATIAVLS